MIETTVKCDCCSNSITVEYDSDISKSHQPPPGWWIATDGIPGSVFHVCPDCIRAKRARSAP